MTDELQRVLGRIEATQELILEELRDQRRRVAALEKKVYTWSGAIVIVMFVWGFVSDSIARGLGWK